MRTINQDRANNSGPIDQQERPARFRVGLDYETRSAGDHEAVYRFFVIERTRQYVWFKNAHTGENVRVKIIMTDEQETCLPFGRYSMAPVLKAGRRKIK